MARSSFYIRLFAVLAAIVIGLVIGSWTELFDDSPSSHSLISASQPAEEPVAGVVKLPSDQSTAPLNQPATELPAVGPDPVVIGSEGVRIRAARDDTGFLGYLVLDKGQDSRLSDDAIIVAINGAPVEDSAAGSELLLIALESEDSQIKLTEVGPK